MSPNNDGKIIRLQVPPMSGEQRTKMVARIKKASEDAKVACRNIRRDANKHFDLAEKEKEMTEDERDSGKESVQVLLKESSKPRSTSRPRRSRRKSSSSNPGIFHRLTEPQRHRFAEGTLGMHNLWHACSATLHCLFSSSNFHASLRLRDLCGK